MTDHNDRTVQGEDEEVARERRRREAAARRLTCGPEDFTITRVADQVAPGGVEGDEPDEDEDDLLEGDEPDEVDGVLVTVVNDETGDLITEVEVDLETWDTLEKAAAANDMSIDDYLTQVLTQELERAIAASESDIPPVDDQDLAGQ